MGRGNGAVGSFLYPPDGLCTASKCSPGGYKNEPIFRQLSHSPRPSPDHRDMHHSSYRTLKRGRRSGLTPRRTITSAKVFHSSMLSTRDREHERARCACAPRALRRACLPRRIAHGVCSAGTARSRSVIRGRDVRHAFCDDHSPSRYRADHVDAAAAPHFVNGIHAPPPLSPPRALQLAVNSLQFFVAAADAVSSSALP